jgi:hypothetical protein
MADELSAAHATYHGICDCDWEARSREALDPVTHEPCGCGHPWNAHQGRNGGERCLYSAFAGYTCPCRRKNPDIEAEERLAAAAWNAYMGRSGGSVDEEAGNAG